MGRIAVIRYEWLPNIQIIKYVVHEDDTKNVNIANSTFVHDDGLGFWNCMWMLWKI